MKLVEFLQGKWLGHPLHSAMVHIPVGLWIAVALTDAAWALGAGFAVLPRLGLYAGLLGTGVALLAIPAGIADWSPIKREKPAWRIGLCHMILNTAALLVWFANIGLRVAALDTIDPIPPAVWGTSAVGAAIVIGSGYLGSRMVFDQGTAVARESKRKWRSIAQRGGANLPPEK